MVMMMESINNSEALQMMMLENPCHYYESKFMLVEVKMWLHNHDRVMNIADDLDGKNEAVSKRKWRWWWWRWLPTALLENIDLVWIVMDIGTTEASPCTEKTMERNIGTRFEAAAASPVVDCFSSYFCMWHGIYVACGESSWGRLAKALTTNARLTSACIAWFQKLDCILKSF